LTQTTQSGRAVALPGAPARREVPGRQITSLPWDNWPASGSL